jgi:hypothetical protein
VAPIMFGREEKKEPDKLLYSLSLSLICVSLCLSLPFRALSLSLPVHPLKKKHLGRGVSAKLSPLRVPRFPALSHLATEVALTRRSLGSNVELRTIRSKREN